MANVRYSRRSTRRPNRSARSTIRGKPKASKNKSAIYKLTRQVDLEFPALRFANIWQCVAH